MINKWIVLLLTILFWGLAFTAIKYSVSYLDPIELASLRFAVADLFFIAGIAIGGFRIKRKDVPAVFILGLFGVAIYHIFLNAGEIYVSSGIASLIISTAPIFVLILSWMFLKEKVTKMKILGVLIAFTGVALLSKPESGGNLLGVIFVFISAVSAAAYTVLGKKLMDEYDSVTLTNGAVILGSLPILIFSFSGLKKILLYQDFGLTFSVLFLGIFSTYLGYLGWYYFLEREEASRASVFLLAIPFVALMAGAFLLKENITTLTILGGMAVIIGILLVIKEQRT
jgi:drug/metabolite transporter (DMT)-like permease